jgi:hypothetical protein
MTCPIGNGRHPDDRIAGHTGTGILIWRCAACGREETRRPMRPEIERKHPASPSIANPEPTQGNPRHAEIEAAYLAAGDHEPWPKTCPPTCWCRRNER